MVELSFGIAAYAACDTQTGNDIDIHRDPSDDFHADAARPAVPTLLRRRVTPIGQAILRAAWALPHVEHARFVFASRHGEFDRTWAMLEQMAGEDGPLPFDFSLGVHNALAGLLSVATRNRAGHTALAAGIDSFGFGLMEAAVCLLEHPREPVMLAYYDAGLPPDYPDTVRERDAATLALAIVLVPPHQTREHVVMRATPTETYEPDEPAAAVFLRFLRETAVSASANGELINWSWRHV